MNVILVTIRAFTVFKRFGHVARSVALLAFQQAVLPQKRKISLVVVEGITGLNILE